MSGLDYGLLGVLALGVILALRHQRNRKKKGCSGCCAGCAWADDCMDKK